MPVFVVGNSKSVSAPDATSRAIWDALVKVGERFGADAVLSTECACVKRARVLGRISAIATTLHAVGSWSA